MPVTINGSGATGSINTAVLPSSGTFATQSYADTAGGLVKIVTQSFSAVSSVSVDNCFTSTYDNYRIYLRFLMSATTAELRSRLRLAGTDNSTATSYQRSGYLATATSSLAVNGAAADHLFHGATSTSGAHAMTLDVLSPAVAESTFYFSNFFQGTGNLAYGHGALHTVATAYDGISVYVSTGTFTGRIRVYGYRNS